MCTNKNQDACHQNGDIESSYPAANVKPQPTFHPSQSLSVLRRVAVVLARAMFFGGLILCIVALIWYFMGPVFVAQLVIVAIVAYLAAGGGYKWFYIALRTLPRDTKALHRYLLMLWVLRRLSRNNMSVAAIFREYVKKNPKKVCFVFEDKEWTRAEVEAYSDRVANLFLSHGYRKGDTVALMLENRPEFVCIWLGLSKIGVVTALINYNLRQTSLLHSVNVAKAQAFIFGEDCAPAVKEISHSLSGVRLYRLTLGEPLYPLIDMGERQLVPLLTETPATPASLDEVGYHDKLLYIYTSGTTGLPKAAVITNARFVFLAGALGYQVGFRPSDRIYTPLPLYHTAGGAMSVGQALCFGSCVAIRKKFSASAYFSDIIKYNCTIGQYIGEMCRYVLATPVRPDETKHKLRILYGNGLRPQIWDEFVTRFKVPQVAEFYGATEGNANIVNNDNTKGACGFISRIIPQIYPISIIKVDEVTGEPIRNSKGLCIVCGPNEPGVFIGKIIPSNPARAFLGYVNEKESERKIVRDVFRKGDSAFLSGDLVVADDLGYLYFKDRTGDTFRWKGENVSTSEVEGVVSNLTDYRDCVVYGVEVRGHEGRAGMVAIVDKNNTLNLAALAEGIRKALPSYARPIFVRVLHDVEMTGTYKLKKLDLQKEGFNLKEIKDHLYYLSSAGLYEPLTMEVYANIDAGKMRL